MLTSNINAISFPSLMNSPPRAQTEVVATGRKSPETVDVMDGGVSFKRQQSESGGDGVNAEMNADMLGKVYISYVNLVPTVPICEVDLVLVSNRNFEISMLFMTWEWKCARTMMRLVALAFWPARSAKGTSSDLWSDSLGTGTTCSSSGGPLS